MEQYQEVYTDVASRIEEAFGAFRRTYELMYPPPTMPDEIKHNWGWKQAGMFLGLLGSVIVSASHTIPIFVGSGNVTIMTIVIGVAVFVMVEMGIVVFAYSSTEQQHKTREDIRTRVKQFTRTGLYFIVTVAIAANVVYVIERNMTIPDDPLIQNTWNGVRLVIFLAVGFSAPVIAFLTGEILAVDVLEHQSRFNRAMERYEAEYKEWVEALNRSWSSQRKKWGGAVDVSLEQIDPVQLPSAKRPMLSNGTDTRTTGYGYNRSEDASDLVRSYLKDNPDNHNLSVRQLAEIIGVGKSTVSRVRKEMQDNGEILQ